MSNRDEILDRLNDVHEFPGSYVFKIIGANTPEFVSLAVQACLNILGPNASPDVKTRESSGGRHVSVTIDATVPDAETVLAVYDVFSELPDVKFVL